jgi:hypothetical protein
VAFDKHKPPLEAVIVGKKKLGPFRRFFAPTTWRAATLRVSCGKIGLELSKTHAARATRIFLAAHTAFCFAKPKNSVSLRDLLPAPTQKGRPIERPFCVGAGKRT